MKPLLQLLRYARPYAVSLAAAYACMFVFALTTAFLAFLTGPALNFIFSGNLNDVLLGQTGEIRTMWRWLPTAWVTGAQHLSSTAALWVVPVLLVATAVVKGLCQTGQLYLLGRTSQSMLRALREDAFAALLTQPPTFFERRTHGDLLSRLTHDANLVEQAVFNGCGPMLRDTLAVVILLVFCFVTDSSLALLTFITVPLAVWPLSRFTGWLKRVSRHGQQAQGHINAVCYEALAGVRVVQAFGAEAHEQSRLRRAAADYWAQLRLSYLIRALRTPTMEILGTMALAALVALLGYRVQHTHADPAHYISFFAAIVMMYDPLKKLGAVSDYLAAGAAASQRLMEIIQLTPPIRDKADAIAMGGFQDAVRFESVGFTYGDKPVLCDVNLTLPRGSMVALVGASGAGKSTLGHLLPRFYDVTSGRICFDDHDIRDIRLKHLRAQVSVVGQETFLFNTTVANNVAYGCPDASRAAIERAACAAFADAFIQELPHGYDTVIGEQGITLSGGQRQRLAIARALLRDAPLLILDEATSHLDVESERFLQAAFDTLLVGRTALVIAHRLSTVRHADAIAVLKNGRIVEQGKHEVLLRQRGEYARLYAMQFLERPSNVSAAAAAAHA